MNYKMIVTDLDGTLIHTDNNISERTKKAFDKCKKHGVYIAIATARYWITSQRYCEVIRPDYEITTDGSLIHNGSHEVFNITLGLTETNQIIKSIVEHTDSKITVALGQQILCNSRNSAIFSYPTNIELYDFSEPLTFPANKIVAKLPNFDIASKIALNNHCSLYSYQNNNWYAFLPKKASKALAIKKLTAYLNIALDDVIAFGDSENDIEMLDLCGLGIAVENALPIVKNAADLVVSSNDNDGVAKWIEINILPYL